ncbi:MAG: Cyclopropane-fatty-acyl-phospholipid synthase [Nitrospirota bacterium]|jgi:cyclopropane-fatty-acyl-phospholipid synthase
MNETMITSGVMVERVSGPVSPPSGLAAQLYRLARRAVFARMKSLRQGSVIVVDGRDRQTFGEVTADCPLQAIITIHNLHTYVDVALGGTIGVADAYRRGFWSCDDLTTLVRIFVLNRELLDGVEGGLAILTRPLLKAMHWLNRNTKTGSRRNIAAHYDLGNDFFRLVLDETMMYSCAYFERRDVTLAEASRAKNDRICRKLQLSASDHLLEIGTGWGGFAIHAASQYGCRVTTTTISRQQFDLAVQRIESAGLRDRVTVIQTDYRDLPQLSDRFDKLVSIEMIEAVGHHYFDAYFDVCSRMLKPDGLMLLQGITIDEQLYERAKRSVDFIKYFMFPGSCIPSVSALIAAAAKSGGLNLVQLEDIGAHYVPTLQAWRKNAAQALTSITALGYPPDFVRLWDFYLSYCEGGFTERSISNVHLLLAKSGWRSAPVAC